jgi:molecular chaperone GrpE
MSKKKKKQEEAAQQQDTPAEADEAAVDASDPTADPNPTEEIDWKDRCLRAKADFANLQRRAAEERVQAVRFANADFGRALLDVLDDFERTLGAAESAEQVADVVKGVELVHEKLLKALKDNAIEPIAAQGVQFNPNEHEALMQQDSTTAEPGTVLQEVRRGYRLHNRIIRPSSVIVAKAPEPVEAESASPTEE